MKSVDASLPAAFSERFAVIDLLRGFACVSVVLFHYVWRGPQVVWMSGVEFPLLAELARYGYLGVHLFFMISGFVILMSALHATPSSFVASRVARLYPAFWVAAGMTALSVWLAQDVRFMLSPAEFAINLSMFAHWFKVPYVDGAYWSLAVELHFYIIVWIVLRFRLLRYLEALLGAWLLVSAANYLRPMYPLEFWLDAKWAPLFVAGCLFLRWRIEGLSRLRGALLAVAFVLAELYALREAGDDVAQGRGAMLIVLLMFVLFVMIAKGMLQRRPSAITQWVGVLTYPVYLIHQNFGYVLHEQLTRLNVEAWTALVIMSVLVLALAWLIHCQVEVRLAPRLKRGVLRFVARWA